MLFFIWHEWVCVCVCMVPHPAQCRNACWGDLTAVTDNTPDHGSWQLVWWVESRLLHTVIWESRFLLYFNTIILDMWPLKVTAREKGDPYGGDLYWPSLEVEFTTFTCVPLATWTLPWEFNCRKSGQCFPKRKQNGFDEHMAFYSGTINIYQCQGFFLILPLENPVSSYPVFYVCTSLHISRALNIIRAPVE